MQWDIFAEESSQTWEAVQMLRDASLKNKPTGKSGCTHDSVGDANCSFPSE